MPVPLTIDFLPPTIPGIVALRIYEADSPNSVFNQIERTTAVGTYPDYITRYVTQLANSKDDYFAIAWENAEGEVTELSASVQGGTITLVGIITNRMLLRDPTLDENIAAQEAEAAISDYYGVLDPYTIDPSTVSPSILSGLTMLALARAYVFSLISGAGSVASYTAGLVQQSSGSSTKAQLKVQELVKLANSFLGRNYSIVALMEEVEVGGGFRRLTGVDLTRGIIEIQ